MRAAKSRLISAGSSTLLTATPAPITADPMNSAATLGAQRIPTPTPARAAEPTMQRSRPHRSATFGATVAKTPKQRSGRTVSRLVRPALRCVSARNCGVSGAGATRSDRWLKPTATNPAAKATNPSVGVCGSMMRPPPVVGCRVRLTRRGPADAGSRKCRPDRSRGGCVGSRRTAGRALPPGRG